jgi:hypothetical protein
MARLVIWGREKPTDEWTIRRDFDQYYDDVNKGHMGRGLMGIKIRQERRDIQQANPTHQFALGTRNIPPEKEIPGLSE